MGERFGKRTLFVVISAVIGFVVLAPRAAAASWQDGPPDGARWQTGSVAVLTHVVGFGPQIKRAVADWNRSDVVHMTITTGASDEATRDACDEQDGFVVVCVSNGTGDNVNYAGWTQTYTNAAGFTSGVVVWLNEAVLTNSAYTRSDLRSLACHELGHAVGLVHRDGSSCMNATAWFAHPDSFDYQTLDALYAGTYGP